MVVVFPAPLGPSRQNSCPSSIPNQEPLMAQKSGARPPQQLPTPGKRLRRPYSSTARCFSAALPSSSPWGALPGGAWRCGWRWVEVWVRVWVWVWVEVEVEAWVGGGEWVEVWVRLGGAVQ